MACTPQVTLPVPDLGGGLSLSITLPSVAFDVALCCKTLPFDTVTPPIPIDLGTPLPPAVNVAIANTIATVQRFLDGLQVRCPLE